MQIAITGSIASDHLMTFPGRFADSLVVEQLDKISLSFLVEELEVRRGGVAANVAFGMAGLGLRPLLVAEGGDETPRRLGHAAHRDRRTKRARKLDCHLLPPPAATRTPANDRGGLHYGRPPLS